MIAGQTFAFVYLQLRFYIFMSMFLVKQAICAKCLYLVSQNDTNRI